MIGVFDYVKKKEFEEFKEYVKKSRETILKYMYDDKKLFEMALMDLNKRINTLEQSILQTLEQKFSNRITKKEREWDERLVSFLNMHDELLGTLRNDYFKLKKEIDELYNNLRDNGDEILRAHLKEYGKKVDSANARIKKLEEKLKQLEQENKKLREENDELREFVEASLREMKEMKRQIEILISKGV